MRERKVGLVVLCVSVLLMGWSMITSSASFFGKQQNRHGRKTMLSVEASSSLEPNRMGSSVVFPVDGNVYPIGSYNVTLNIGQPPKPYFLDPDTGSDLTWLQCDAPCEHCTCTETYHPLYRPSNDFVPSNDPLCASLHAPPHDHRSDKPEQCHYEVEYADGGSSLGVLVRDAFSFNFSSGSQLKPHLALGCGYNQLPGASDHNMGASDHNLDGVLGLGRGKAGIVSQLESQGFVRNVVGHCFSGEGGGFVFFGDEFYDSSRIAWTPMSQDDSKQYSAGFAELILGGKSTDLNNLRTIFDSGSTFTYLTSQAYQALTSWIKEELNGKTFEEASDDRTLPLCWKGGKPFKSLRDVKEDFKSLALIFANDGRAKTQFELTPEAYLLISAKGNVCLGILNGTEAGLEDFNVIGDISMQDKMVIYDNEKQLIGWVSANCDWQPKSSRFSIR